MLTVASAGTANAGDAPRFLKETWPSAGVEAAWQEFQAVMDPDGALDARTKALVGLATAAPIPCEYRIHYHTCRIPPLCAGAP